MELQELGVITPTGPHTNIQAAVNAAAKSPGAAVWIPAWYNGGDSVPAAPGVPVFDMSGTNGSFKGVTGNVFDVRDYGWVGDDVTDNCGAPVTNFAAAVNAYSGPGTPVALLAPGPNHKAYKLATCNLAFLVPVLVDFLGSTLDCTSSLANCIQLGPTGLSNFANTQLPRYTVQNGTMVGGASLTTAGIEIEPYISASKIVGMNFINFGAGNATLGNCTNFAVKWDTPNNSLMFVDNHWWSFDATGGRCAISNPSDGGLGSNTGVFENNSIEATAAPGFTSPCASQGLVEGGYQSVIAHNNIYGFGVPIRMNASSGGVGLSTMGTQIHHNQLDTGGCIANGKHSVIQYGANGGSQ